MLPLTFTNTITVLPTYRQAFSIPEYDSQLKHFFIILILERNSLPKKSYSELMLLCIKSRPTEIVDPYMVFAVAT